MPVKLKQVLGYYDYLYVTCLPILMIFAATQKYDSWTLPINIGLSLILISLWLIRGKKIEIPDNFILYFLFVAILGIHFLFFSGNLSYILLFASGGLVWLSIFNLRKIVSKYYFYFLIVIGLVIAGIFYILMLNGISVTPANNLFLPVGKNILHNHLGDLWAVILVAVIYKMSEKFEVWQIPLFLLATVLIAQSFSRSAIAALIFGILFIYQTSAKKGEYKKRFSIIFVAAVVLFIVLGAFKTTLFSRPYLFEAFNSLIKTPLGIGVGNFMNVSKYSSMAHSLILELIADLGVFSFIFLFWLYKIFRSLIKNEGNMLAKAVFLAIFVNFFFDTTYSIPAMIWLWFSTLALTKTY